MALTGSPNTKEATGVGFPISDYLGSLNAAIAILGAIRYKEKTGKGQNIDLAMYDGTLSLMRFHGINEWLRDKEESEAYKDQARRGWEGVANTTYKVKDGHLVMTILRDRMWPNFLKAVGKDNKKNQDIIPRVGQSNIYGDGAAGHKLITEALADKKRDEVIEELGKVGVSAGPILTPKEVAEDPHVKERLITKVYHPKLKREVEILRSPWGYMSETPGTVERLPISGGDTEEVLMTILGYNKEEVEKLNKEGVFIPPKT